MSRASDDSIREPVVVQSESRVVQSEKREAHARVPSSVLKCKGLSLDAKAVYAGLALHAFHDGNVYIGQRRLAEVLGTSQMMVSRKLIELAESGVIQIAPKEKRQRASYKLVSNVFRPKEQKIGAGKAFKPRQTERQRVASASSAAIIRDEILGA